MCSIAGIISLTADSLGPGDVADIVAMNRALRHRGPDGYGFCAVAEEIRCWYNRDNLGPVDGVRALLAHNRLAILDLADAALQPFVSASGASVVVYNGEVYNYLELARSTGLGGLRTTSDTEVMLELIERSGIGAVNDFVGMWAFCHYNRTSGEFLFCVDRFGQKPLYYTVVDGRFYFASELKSFLAVERIRFAFDETAIRHYLQHGIYVTENDRTFYRDIRKVAPSQCLRIRDGRIERQTYYAPPETGPRLVEGELIARARELFADSIRFRSRADVPLACSLSGGIDSSTVVAFLARELAPKPLRCYTIDVGDRFENEVESARSVAALNGCEHVAHPVTDRFTLAEVDEYIAHLEEPQEFIGPIGQHALYARVAGDGYKIILDGQVGDEAFCGYYWFIPHVLREWFSRRPLATARTLLGYLAKRNASFRTLFFSWKNELFPGLDLDRTRNLLKFSIPRADNFLVRKLTAARSWKERQRIAYFDYELQSLLRDADRNSMRHGIENRLPFIDHRLFELTNTCDSLGLIRDGWNKYVSRSFADDGMIPPAVRWNRVKRGFYIEYRDTMAEIRARLPELRADDYLAGLVDFEGHGDAIARHEGLLWRLYNLHVLRKRYVVKEG